TPLLQLDTSATQRLQLSPEFETRTYLEPHVNPWKQKTPAEAGVLLWRRPPESELLEEEALEGAEDRRVVGVLDRLRIRSVAHRLDADGRASSLLVADGVLQV